MAAISQIPRNSVGPAQLQFGAVTTQKLRDNAVTSAKVRNRTLLRADFKVGQLPTGATGPQGPPGVSAREQVAAETPLNSQPSKTITVTCPAEKKVLGGGVELSGAGRSRVTATENKPAGDNAWEGEAFEAVNTTQTWKLVVHAICANVT